MPLAAAAVADDDRLWLAAGKDDDVAEGLSVEGGSGSWLVPLADVEFVRSLAWEAADALDRPDGCTEEAATDAPVADAAVSAGATIAADSVGCFGPQAVSIDMSAMPAVRTGRDVRMRPHGKRGAAA